MAMLFDYPLIISQSQYIHNWVVVNYEISIISNITGKREYSNAANLRKS